MFAAQSKLMLFFATLASRSLAAAAAEEMMMMPSVDSREPREKCRDWKFPKSTKKTKKTKSAEINQCICPCCNLDSCQDLMVALDANEGSGMMEVQEDILVLQSGAVPVGFVELENIEPNNGDNQQWVAVDNNNGDWVAVDNNNGDWVAVDNNNGDWVAMDNDNLGIENEFQPWVEPQAPSGLTGVNDGTGPFCAVGGTTRVANVQYGMATMNGVTNGYATLQENCLYDDDGNLDFLTGVVNLGDCCDNLGAQHSGGKCETRRKRSRKLNRASASNERTVTTHKDGVTVEVKAAEPSSLDWIHSHVIEMKEHMEQGDVTGEWDSLFEAYFDNSHHIDMNCDTDSADSLSCKYSSQTQCGRDLISAHAGYHKEMADSIRNGGSHKIAKEQLKPDSCP